VTWTPEEQALRRSHDAKRPQVVETHHGVPLGVVDLSVEVGELAQVVAKQRGSLVAGGVSERDVYHIHHALEVFWRQMRRARIGTLGPYGPRSVVADAEDKAGATGIGDGDGGAGEEGAEEEGGWDDDEDPFGYVDG